MNRNEEYLELIKELDASSEKINNLYKKANKKFVKHQIIKISASSSIALALFFLIFAILINNTSSFAYACGKLPILKDLAKFTALSPSLKAAVEYQYVQPIELSKTKDDLTATVEYIIVDQKQVNIFFSMKSEKNTELNAFPEIYGKSGDILECISLYGDFDEESNLRMITLDFINENVPDYISLKLNIKNNEGYSSVFEFGINLDPNYTAQGETILLNKEFEVDGQFLKITSAEIYPTHIRINFADNEKNTKWIKSINFRLEDEKGNVFQKISNGISATSDENSAMMSSHRLESNFFSKSDELILFIESITWLDKNEDKIKIDLVNKKTDTVSEYFKLHNVEKRYNEWAVSFIMKSEKPNHTFNVFSRNYYDEYGNEYHINRSSTITSLYDDKDNNILNENQFLETLYLEYYDYDEVYLMPSFSSIYKLDNAIEIKIK